MRCSQMGRNALLRRLIETVDAGDLVDPCAEPSEAVVPFDLQALIDASPLNPAQRRLIEERLKGRSFREIAAMREFSRPNGLLCTRQCLQRMERRVMAILAPEVRTVDCWLAHSRAERSQVMRERAALVSSRELHHEPERVSA